MSYEKKFLLKLFKSGSWININNTNFLDQLTELANDSFGKDTFEGYMASLLIYHQLCEEMVLVLLDESYFYIQCSLYPVKFEKEINRKKMMFGQCLGLLADTIDFPGKRNIICKFESFNIKRNKIAHELTKFNSTDEIKDQVIDIKDEYLKIWNSFCESHEWFINEFRSFQGNNKWDTILVQYEKDIIKIKEELNQQEENSKLLKELKEKEQLVYILDENYRRVIRSWDQLKKVVALHGQPSN